MDSNYFILLPEMILALTAMVILILAPTAGRGRQSLWFGLSLAGLGAAALANCWQWGVSSSGFFGMVYVDNFVLFARLLFFFSTAAVILMTADYPGQESLPGAEFVILLLLATVGMGLMVASADLILTFLGIEVLSIATYVLAGFPATQRSAESAWKYFILGAFSTAFLLYGVALLYGVTGSTQYATIARVLDSSSTTLPLLLGLGLILVGFSFKAALAPFQVWTPDVYQGAPIPITAHLAVASKAAALATLVRILHQAIPELADQWQGLLWISAVLTMLLGNLAALAQTNLKRMLAYSSIAHAGYLLVGLVAFSSLGTRAVLFYLCSYALMTLGAFAVVQRLAQREERRVNLLDYKGIGFRYPFLAISLSTFLVSMAGIPTTAGFMGKLFLFSAALEKEMYWLVILALLASAIGVYYYLRVIVFMFMRSPEGERRATVVVPVCSRLTIVTMVIGTLVLGLFPEALLELIRSAEVF